MDFLIRLLFSVIAQPTPMLSTAPTESIGGYVLVNFTEGQEIEEKEVEIESKEQSRAMQPRRTISGFDRDKILLMCLFSKISYGDPDVKLQTNHYRTVQSLKDEGYAVIPFHKSSQNAGCVFLKDREINIAYHGTKNLDDIICDINVLFVTSRLLPKGGRLHRGFYHAFKESWDQLFKIIKEYAASQSLELSDLTFNLTGHSMGGAIAKVTALCLVESLGVQDVNVATFGEPRVFDATAADVYDRRLQERTVRVTQHHQDVVPAMSPGFFGYKHVGSQLRLDLTPGITAHKLNGYHQALLALKDDGLVANNQVSIFYIPSRMLQHVNAYTLGVLQHYLGQIIRALSSREDWTQKMGPR